MYKDIRNTVLNIDFEDLVGAGGCDAFAQHREMCRRMNDNRLEPQLDRLIINPLRVLSDRSLGV